MPRLDPTEEAIANNPLPPSFKQVQIAITKWVDHVVPCVTKPQSEEITETVVEYLRRRGVADATIYEAMSKSVYKFTYPMRLGAQFMQLVNHDRGRIANMLDPRTPPAMSP